MKVEFVQIYCFRFCMDDMRISFKRIAKYYFNWNIKYRVKSMGYGRSLFDIAPINMIYSP